MNFSDFFIGFFHGFPQGRRRCGHAEHSSARRNEFAFFVRFRAGKQNIVCHVFGKGDRAARFIRRGISVGRQHDACARAVRKFRFRFRKGAVRYRLHHGEEIGFQKGQNDLRFGISETAVVLDDLRSVFRQHETEI